MSITKSYNKYNNIYYAYETSYEWDEVKQKKVQKRKCIGQFDPATGKVIPNGKVGRPVKPFPIVLPGTDSNMSEPPVETAPVKPSPDLGKLVASLEAIENSYTTLASQYHDLTEEIRRLSDQNGAK